MSNINNNFSTGIKVYENLGLKNNDRYQYIPHITMKKTLNDNFDFGNFNFYSSGSNDLKNTNTLRSSIINDFNFESKNF